MRALFHAVVLAGVVFLLAIPAYAAVGVSVSEIVEMSEELSGVSVSVDGELIGDYGFRDDGSMWTQLNGDRYSIQPVPDGGSPSGPNIGIGVRIPGALARDLDPPGGYRDRGPLVRVEGVWKYHDPDRLGESYLDVQTLEVIEPGRELEESVNVSVALVGVVLLAIAGALFILRTREE